MTVLDRFSATTFPWGRRPPTLHEILKTAQHAEALGYSTMNIAMVNLLVNDGPFARYENKYTLDALAVLPAMVTATKKIPIVVDAIPLPQLPPFEWAKYFSSLDVISGGRIVVGMCLGHGDPAFAAYGVDRRKRGKMADEQVEIITRLWSEESVTFEGQFYSLQDVRMEPKPIQKPYPPIWWGGRQKSIPRAARYCQYLNTLWPTLDEVRNEYVPQMKQETGKWGTNTKLSSLFYTRITPDREMSDEEVNDWFGGLMDMEVPVIPRNISIAGSPEQCAAKIKAYMDAGMDHFVLDFQRHGLEPYETNIQQMDVFVEKVLPLLE